MGKWISGMGKCIYIDGQVDLGGGQMDLGDPLLHPYGHLNGTSPDPNRCILHAFAVHLPWFTGACDEENGKIHDFLIFCDIKFFLIVNFRKALGDGEPFLGICPPIFWPEPISSSFASRSMFSRIFRALPIAVLNSLACSAEM